MNATTPSHRTPRGHGPLLRGISGVLAALALTATMMFCVACTRNSDGSITDTEAHTHGTATDHRVPGTAEPLNPDAGTVNPDGDAGTPPTGSQRGILPRFLP